MTFTDDEYSAHHRLLKPMGDKIEGLVRDVMTAESITVHSIRHRVKTAPSTRAKLAANSGKYGALTDLHDFLGVRVITHLASDVDAVAGALRETFEIDEIRSFDKQGQLDPDRFGYLSYHLVAKLSDSRSSLPEWRPYAEIWFEIQIRSILQHAWAEIEHDLGYKSTSIIPPQVKRRFARLAGLLELADSEFVGIAASLSDHVEAVESAVDRGASVAIDAAAVGQLIAHNSSLREADDLIARALETTLLEEASRRYADSMASHLSAAGFSDTDEVSMGLRGREDRLAKFAAEWILRDVDKGRVNRAKVRRHVIYSRGIALFYLAIDRAITDDNVAFFDRMTKLGAEDNFKDLRAVHSRTIRRDAAVPDKRSG